jgi:prepilin-type N-terminal cleavage/methylation domain-containing protein
MHNKTLGNNRGFTLVEVIVVAVIVAVLALVSIQLYRGYVTESRQNTAENIGAAAASFIQAALNSSAVDEGGSSEWTATIPLSGDADAPANTWIATMPNSEEDVSFTCPIGFEIIDGTIANSVAARYIANPDIVSADYPYDIAGE